MDKGNADKQMMKKTDADLIIPVRDEDPKGSTFYNKTTGKKILKGAFAGGIPMSIIFWLVASGNLPLTGLGQISSADFGAAAFLGFITGSAIGGLAGGISGLYKI